MPCPQLILSKFGAEFARAANAVLMPKLRGERRWIKRRVRDSRARSHRCLALSARTIGSDPIVDLNLIQSTHPRSVRCAVGTTRAAGLQAPRTSHRKTRRVELCHHLLVRLEILRHDRLARSCSGSSTRSTPENVKGKKEWVRVENSARPADWPHERMRKESKNWGKEQRG